MSSGTQKLMSIKVNGEGKFPSPVQHFERMAMIVGETRNLLLFVSKSQFTNFHTLNGMTWRCWGGQECAHCKSLMIPLQYYCVPVFDVFFESFLLLYIDVSSHPESLMRQLRNAIKFNEMLDVDDLFVTIERKSIRKFQVEPLDAHLFAGYEDTKASLSAMMQEKNIFDLLWPRHQLVQVPNEDLAWNGFAKILKRI